VVNNCEIIISGEFNNGDEEFLEGFNRFFTGEAADSVWVHPKGDWIE